MTQSPINDQPSTAAGLSATAQALALAQMLAARLSHDVAGLVGSLSGMLEMAADDPEAFTLACDTATALQERLKLLRIAFGATDQEIGFDEIRTLLAALPTARRVSLRLNTLKTVRIFSAARARLLICVAMLGVESLAGDGELVLQENEDGSVMVAANGPRASWPAGFAAYLTDAATALEHATDQGPRGILAPFVALLAPAASASVKLLIGPHAETAPPLLITFIA